MEVCAQFLWENNTRILIDWTPGSGQMLKAALMLSVKSICICHNAIHIRVLKDILRAFVVGKIQENNTRFLPSDKDDRLEDCKPARLKLHEMQRKRAGDDMGHSSPAAKRIALGDSIEEMLSTLEGCGATTKPQEKPRAELEGEVDSVMAAPVSGEAAAKEKATPAAKATAAAKATPAAATTTPVSVSVAGPTEDLQSLLQSWSSG